MPLERTLNDVPEVLPVTAGDGEPVDIRDLSSQVAGELGAAIVSKRMIERNIVPCRPLIDVGYDIVAVAGEYIWRVQVKATRYKITFDNSRYQFSTSRSHRVNGQKGRRKYPPGTVDIFACVALETEDVFFFRDSLDTKNTTSFKPGCANHDAWHLFWSGTDAPRTNNN